MSAGREGRRGQGHPLRARLTTYWPVLLVLALVLVGLQRVLTEHWREGSAWLGVAALAAGGLRLALPADRAGLLAIRGRTVDALCYGAFGVVVLLLALTIARSSLDVS